MKKKLATETEIYEAADFYSKWFYQMYSQVNDEDRVLILQKKGFKNITLSSIRNVRLIAQSNIRYEADEFNTSLTAYLENINVFKTDKSKLQSFGLFLSNDQHHLLSLHPEAFRIIFAWTDTGWEAL